MEQENGGKESHLDQDQENLVMLDDEEASLNERVNAVQRQIQILEYALWFVRLLERVLLDVEEDDDQQIPDAA